MSNIPMPSLEAFRLQEFKITTNYETNVRAKHKQRFVRGPIPLVWLQLAAKSNSNGLTVGIVLWWISGMTKSNVVQINLSNLKDWGLQRDSARRGLNGLEKSGLIRIERKPGAKSTIHILEAVTA